MKIVLVSFVSMLLSFQAMAQFKEVGKFNCRSTGVVFPYESPKTLFQLQLEATISTQEYDLSSTPGMSKADIRMAYMIRKSNENRIMEQGIFTQTSFATDLPIATNDYWSVNYQMLASSTTQNQREIYITIPDNFDNYRTFAIKVYIGELNNRNTEPFALSCKNLNYPY